MAKKCGVLKEKLDSLLKTLNEEAQASSVMSAPPPTIAEEQVDGEGVVLAPPPAPPTVTAPCSPRPPAAIFKPREQLMLRANSLKKAIRQIIEHTEKAVDEQNAQTVEGLASLPAEEFENTPEVVGGQTADGRFHSCGFPAGIAARRSFMKRKPLRSQPCSGQAALCTDTQGSSTVLITLSSELAHAVNASLYRPTGSGVRKLQKAPRGESVLWIMTS
ncbi:diacylglycerol kinase delta-like [Cyprinus carpio]|uniref:Diacylglycerol kinase delta-like n=1 Tax=Cyprinus carpio TaxID=7962 RepID=A0A9Q9YXN7_CYPCA|nr:diacylglycerol kinase delta-like [Cyprinus carpio]